jgi:hypothetical protein
MRWGMWGAVMLWGRSILLPVGGHSRALPGDRGGAGSGDAGCHGSDPC